jgi:Mn2+/Fe2+ NRAMP family transporter
MAYTCSGCVLVLLPICYFVHEMVARLGIATGKGHAAMIYERFGKWWGHFSLMDLLVVNFLTLMTEFAAVSLALNAMGVSPIVSVLRFADLKWARVDTLVGAIFTVLVAGAMMLVGNYGYQHHVVFQDPAQLAVVLGPIVGKVTRNCVLLLMVNAAVLGTTAISHASAWAYGEVRGWEHSLHKKLWEAPGFYATYIACVGAAAAIVLIPHVPLQLVMLPNLFR